MLLNITLLNYGKNIFFYIHVDLDLIFMKGVIELTSLNYDRFNLLMIVLSLLLIRVNVDRNIKM